jgi:hypothetical protein
MVVEVKTNFDRSGIYFTPDIIERFLLLRIAFGDQLTIIHIVQRNDRRQALLSGEFRQYQLRGFEKFPGCKKQGCLRRLRCLNVLKVLLFSFARTR